MSFFLFYTATILRPTLLPLYTKECVYFSAYDPARGIMTRKRYYITDNLSISAK